MSKFVTKDLFEITPEIAHLAALCEESNAIDRELYGKYDVKRGHDGTYTWQPAEYD